MNKIKQNIKYLILNNWKFIILTLFVLSNSPDFAQSKYDFANKQRLAQSYLNARQFDKAKSIFEYLNKIQPLNYGVTTSLNKVYIQLKEYDNSIELLKSKIVLSPKNINYYGLLGTTYYTKGERDSASAVWHESILLNPKYEMNYRIIANYMIQNRAYDDAIEILKEGKHVSKNPNIFSYELANLYTVFMKYSNAAEEYCEIINRDPRQLNAVKSRMSAYISKDIALQETLKKVINIAEEKQSDAIKELLAYLYSASAKFSKAFEIIKDLDKAHHENGNRILKFCEDSFRQKDFKIANYGYAYLLKNFSNSPFQLIAKLGYIRSKLKILNVKYKKRNWRTISLPDTNGAFEFVVLANQFVKVLKINNLQNYYKSEMLYSLGIIYKEKLQNYKLAKVYFEKVSKAFPNSNYGILAQKQLGEIGIINNNLKRAEEYFKNISKKYSSNKSIKNSVFYSLAELQFWQGHFDKALQILSTVSGSLKDNFANDAIKLSLIISTLKFDSLSAVQYAKADLLTAQFKYEKAIDYFAKDTLSNQILIKQMAMFKIAELYAAIGDYASTIRYLEKLSKRENVNLYSDESLFLLGKTYLYGLNKKVKAKTIFEKLLAKYPNSVYFTQARKIINDILSNGNEIL